MACKRGGDWSSRCLRSHSANQYNGLLQSGDHVVIGHATLGGADVGVVAGAPFPEREGAAGLFGMWVAPAARGRGMGDRLVEAVVDWARVAGYARVVLDVGDTNVPAIRLYQSKGFEPTGRTATLPEPRTHVREHERALEL